MREVGGHQHVCGSGQRMSLPSRDHQSRSLRSCHSRGSAQPDDRTTSYTKPLKRASQCRAERQRCVGQRKYAGHWPSTATAAQLTLTGEPMSGSSESGVPVDALQEQTFRHHFLVSWMLVSCPARPMSPAPSAHSVRFARVRSKCRCKFSIRLPPAPSLPAQRRPLQQRAHRGIGKGQQRTTLIEHNAASDSCDPGTAA